MSPLSIKNSNHHFHGGKSRNPSSSSFDVADDGISKLNEQQPPPYNKSRDDYRLHHPRSGNLSPVPTAARIMTMIPVSPPPPAAAAAAATVACVDQQEPPLSSESFQPEEVEEDREDEPQQQESFKNTKTVFTTETTTTTSAEQQHQQPPPSSTPSRTTTTTSTTASTASSSSKSRIIVVADYTSRDVELPDYDVNNDLEESFVPSDQDVICGWARQNYNHGGNKKLRQLIESNIKIYTDAATKSEKGQVIVNIVEQIRRESPTGVGMVKLNSSTGRWAYIGTNKAKDKIGHGTDCLKVWLLLALPFEERMKASNLNCPLPCVCCRLFFLQRYAKHPKRTRRSNRSYSRRESSKPKKKRNNRMVVVATRGGILRNTILHRRRRHHRMENIILGRKV